MQTKLTGTVGYLWQLALIAEVYIVLRDIHHLSSYMESNREHLSQVKLIILLCIISHAEYVVELKKLLSIRVEACKQIERCQACTVEPCSSNFSVGDRVMLRVQVVKSGLSKRLSARFNPRTDGGPGHLSTDGGADNRPLGDLENEAS